VERLLEEHERAERVSPGDHVRLLRELEAAIGQIEQAMDEVERLESAAAERGEVERAARKIAQAIARVDAAHQVSDGSRPPPRPAPVASRGGRR
jgi:superfamily II RNA helicase